MGFFLGLIGAIFGAWMLDEARGLFGAVAGFLLGYTLHRLMAAQASVRKLLERVELLEQRNAATERFETTTRNESVPEVAAPVAAARARSAANAVETSARVSVYEPTPPVELATPPDATPLPKPNVMPAAAAAARPTEAAKQRTLIPEPRPSMGAHTIEVAKRWLTTGNVPVKVGVIISFFGVSFLLKYAVENQVLSIPVSFRYLCVAAFAVVLLAIGWRKRDDNRVFALSIQGGGIGVLFLTVFAAFRLHGLLSPTVAFALLIVITAASGYLAIRQESRAFAILGTTGGFLAPLLVSTGSGDHVGLFSYYLILNCAVLGVAWYRAWRELNIIGFVFTFGVGTIWGYQYYVPELFSTTEPFLILYFLFYTAIAVLFAFRQKPQLRGYVDGTLLFGTPPIAFALQSQLLSHTEYGLAISAAIVSAFYAGLAIWLRRTQEQNFALLAQAFIALSVAFGTVAIPLALDDRWTAIAWALEGSAMVWIGVRQSTTLAKLTGTALAFAAGVEFINYGWIDDLGIPVLNGNFMGGALIALSAIYSSWNLLSDERGRDWQKYASIGLLVWGLGWWFGTGLGEISDRASFSNELGIGLAYFGASFLAMLTAANRLQWLTLWQITLGVLPFIGGGSLIAYGWTDNLGLPVLNGNFLGGAMFAWMSLYAARMLRTDERADESFKSVSLALLFWGLCFWFGAGTAEIMDRAPSRLQLHLLLIFGTLSFAAIAFAGKRFDWIAYRRISLLMLPALFVGAIMYLFEHDHFLRGLGILGWPLAVAAHVWILYCHGQSKSRALSIVHGLGAMFFVGLVTIEVYWQVDRITTYDVWSASISLLALAAGAYGLLLERKNHIWPFSEQKNAYLLSGLLLVVFYTMLILRAVTDNPGDPSPLPYIPVLNPFDIISIACVGLLWLGVQQEGKVEQFKLGNLSRLPKLFVAGMALLLSTISVVRIVHHVTDVAWNSSALFASDGVQSTLTIFWAILGLGGMVFGAKKVSRGLWMAGAALMTVVVLKLFVIDLGNSGTVWRIVSFLGVGVMLLVVGYFSPVPPKLTKANS